MLRGLLLALLLLEGVAWADDPLAQARQAVARSDYEAARPALTAALDAGGRGPDDVAEIYRLTGIVDAALGNAKAATDAFTRWLALAPKAALPAGTSPKIRRPFDAAARYFKTHAPLELKLEKTSLPPVITLVLVSDPLNMVARARVVFAVDGGAERTKDVPASERTEIALPAARRIDARVWALDAHGNHLVEIGSKDVPVVIVGEGPPPVATAPVRPPPQQQPPPERPRAARPPLYRRWWPYAAAAGAFAAVGGYFAWSVRSDLDELDRLNADSVHHTFDEARAVEDRGRRDLVLMNIGLGAAGALAITAGVMYALSPRMSVETTVTAAPLPGGGALVVGGTF